MNVKLINTPNPQFGATEQIFYNRGIPVSELRHYVNLSDEDINSFVSLGREQLKAGAIALLHAVTLHKKTIIVIDCDCDGYTSAALLINYLHRLWPSWVDSYVTWSLHEGKEHGLSDHIDMILENDYQFVICPDSSSNDYKYHKKLAEKEIDVLVLDHHLAEKVSEDAIIINNQLSDYPNKELSGVGVTWQFCRYVDALLGKNYADDFIDLVALGNSADMMSLTSFETRYLITKGLRKDKIKNPFIEYMIDKNNFPLTKSDYKPHFSTQACTNIGAAFFITPFVNAVTRSGTLEEKKLIFHSMLNHKAFEKVPEVKRGKETGKTEPLVLQAVRVIGNVKNRQTRAEDAGIALLEQKIKDNNMLDNHILLFLLESGEIDSEIRG